MLLKSKLCVDAGTANCPCHLAEYGKCTVCSRICANAEDGPAACSCQWQGVCIYNEYLQNNKCINEQREDRSCKIQKIKWFDDDLAVMRISVPKGMAEKAALPGSFVFVKAAGAESFFSFPVSVLNSNYEKEYIELAVKVSGPKSRALMESTGKEAVDLRGIYRNGLLGGGRLMSEKPQRVLCLTKGIGLAPVANYMRWAGGKDCIDVIADPEKINRGFADHALDGCIVDSIEFGRLPMNLSWAEEEKYDVIIISASDYYQQNIYVPDNKKVLSNNHAMCCGEGICGACVCMTSDGTAHRMCKECGTPDCEF